MRLHTFLLLGVTAVHLASCAYVGRNVQRAGTEIHEGTVALDQRVRGWFYSEDRDLKESAPKPDKGYCYRTLGEVSCYLQPQSGQKSRMVGLQMPEPAFNELNTPLPVERPLRDYRHISDEPVYHPEIVVAPVLETAKPQDAYETELSGKAVIVDVPGEKDAVLLPMIQPQTPAPQPLMP